MEKNNERFIKTYAQGMSNTIEIWVDSETGVNYIYHGYGYCGGFTMLVNQDGKPIITNINKQTNQNGNI